MPPKSTSDRLFNLATKLGTAVGLGFATWLGETGHDGGFVRDIWKMAQTASPFAAMFAIYAWQRADRERRDAQQQTYERTIDFTNTINAINATIAPVFSALTEMRHLIDGLSKRGMP